MGNIEVVDKVKHAIGQLEWFVRRSDAHLKKHPNDESMITERFYYWQCLQVLKDEFDDWIKEEEIVWEI